MERIKQKSKKDKTNKVVDKEKSSSFITDVKLFKENLKIREILRTVKMNSSMRIKAPRGSKVMQNRDFVDNEEFFEDTVSDDGQDEEVPPSATNTVLNTEICGNYVPEEEYVKDEENPNADLESKFCSSAIYKCKSLSEGLEDRAEFDGRVERTDSISDSLPAESPVVTSRSRDRKLSLDHTILSRREGLSQSEVDLHAIGKLPLERKSSFFRKKMDSFLKNTTEIFKRQSLGSKSGQSPLTQRRGSNCSRMSISLQSLNENSAYDGQFNSKPIHKHHDQQGSVTSLRSSTTSASSNSTVSVVASDRPPEMSEEESLADSRQELTGSQPLPDVSSLGTPYADYMQDSLLGSRASSMSSGLDTATGKRRRKTSSSNRVSWLASESLTDYFRHLIQDEKGQETREAHCSYQDFSTIPENKYGPRPDSKGRRLSYVRAVSREDPVLPSRSHDSSLRRTKIAEYEDNARPAIETVLASFTATGIPPLLSFKETEISSDAARFLEVLGSDDVEAQLIDLDWGMAFEPLESKINVEPSIEKGPSDGPRTEPEVDAATDLRIRRRNEVVKEFICTEAVHIRYLRIIIQVYIAAVHTLQRRNVLKHISTEILFLNIPDILNANITFWDQAIYPMLEYARRSRYFFQINLMIPGFNRFAEIFAPYEEYMENQADAIEYLRKLNTDQDFLTYLTWCDLKIGHRLQLSDMLVKPMQRITKYTLITSRLIDDTVDEVKRQQLQFVETNIKAFIASMNRSCRQKEELNILVQLKIEPYELDFKGDEEAFRSPSPLNLFLPMIDCAHNMLRSLIHQGDIKYKDYQKEFDARVFVFTDMILICKHQKASKDASRWKMQRAKILLHRLVPINKRPKSPNDAAPLVYIILDEHGCAQGKFQLSELSKDPNPITTLKLWEAKIFEAMFTYSLTKWYHRFPVRNHALIEKDFSEDPIRQQHPEMILLERKARDRVAAMIQSSQRLVIPDPGYEMTSPRDDYQNERGPKELSIICAYGHQNFNAWQSRAANFYDPPKGLNYYHFSIAEENASISANSHEDGVSHPDQPDPDSSVDQYDDPPHISSDHLISPPLAVDITSDRAQQQSPPTVMLHPPSPNDSPGPRSASAGAAANENNLRVASPTHSMIHSLPDIHAEFHRIPDPPVIVHSASAKMYRSHQELLQRNRLAANQHSLGPDKRGSSYPPTSPTRPLIRGLAFSYSFMGKSSNTIPPLRRPRNHSTSLQNAPKDLHKDLKRLFGMKAPVQDRPHRALVRQRPLAATTSTSKPDLSMPSTSADKSDKKKTLVQRRSMSASPERNRDEQSDDTDYDADDDRSRRSSKSAKGDKKLRLESRILEDPNITIQDQNNSEELEDLRKRVKKNKDKI